ncbi:T9SS type A sorting domain-containing protein [Dokdonia ponticola]|uniref:T9SS type A sorting domain-containing protein n=1 Tax=Dokdonia ponticola TaxID=2041041 RepID=A0ABV9HZ87_9FLAO
MKKIITLVLLLVICNLNAQIDYELTVLNETYENLENATSLNNGELWDDPSFNVPIGFDFQLGPNEFNTLFFSDDALGGLLTTIANIDAASFGGFALVAQDIIDRGFNTGTSLSPLSFKLEGEVGSQILKIEWNNVGFFDESSLQDFMNFQLWLYEEGNVIEYRYGPSEINDPTSSFEGLDGIQVILFPLLPAGGQGPLEEDAYILSGDPVNPEFITISTEQDFIDAELTSLTGVPPNGTVYRFSSETLSIDDTDIVLDLNIYPNPTNDVFKIESKMIDYTLEVYNTSGKRVLRFDSPKDSYSVSNLSKGVYFVRIQSTTEVVTKRLIKS